MARPGALPFLLVLLALVAILARAEEWHEAYRNGVNALARGQGERAVELLERAAAQRPQPGRNVVTYGTNVEERYYPYLRLAEAYLLLRNLEGARSSLKRSESWGGEPAAERARLLAQVEEAAARLAAPPTTRTPPTTAPPPPARAPPTTEAAPTPTPVPPPTPSLATPEPVRAAPLPRRASSLETVPSSRDPGREAPAEGACSLEVVSRPAPASTSTTSSSGPRTRSGGAWCGTACPRGVTASVWPWRDTGTWPRKSSCARVASPTFAAD